MKNLIQLVILCASLSLFAACDLDDSLSNRIVGGDTPIDRDLSSEDSDDIEEDPELEDHINEDTTDNAVMLWEEKVLRNSNINPTALRKAITYYDANKTKLNLSKRYMAIFDYSQHSSKKRFYIIDLVDGSVEQLVSSHGVGSDSKNTGYATTFSNVNNSKQSSLGFVRGAERYYSSKFKSDALRLDGLETRNSRVRSRAIVIHAADYVTSSNAGRSWGCPAFERNRTRSVVNRLENGALIYLFHPSQP